MTDIASFNEEALNKYAEEVQLKVVPTPTKIDGDTFQRELDLSDINEIQQSTLTNISNRASYTIGNGQAIFTVNIRTQDIGRTIEKRESNEYFPDDVSAELVLAREAAWIATTISNGKHLQRTIGRPDNYWVELSPSDNGVTMNIVF